MPYDLVVVGAGMAGLAAARAAADRGLRPLVLEAADRVGGRVDTRLVHGFPVDLGAGFLTNLHRETHRLIATSGLAGDRLTLTARSAVVDGPERFVVDAGSPKEVARMLPLRVWPGLVQLALATLVDRRLDPADLLKAAPLDDDSATMFESGLPPEISRRLLDPALRGFLYWEPEATSQAALRVLIRAALTLRRFTTLRGGLARLPQALAQTVSVRLGCRVVAVRRELDGWIVDVVGPSGSQSIPSPRVVFAAPASVTAPLIESVAPGPAEIVAAGRYSSAVVVARVVRQRSASGVSATFVADPASTLVLATSMSGRLGRLPAAGDVVTLYGMGRARPFAPAEQSAADLVSQAHHVVPDYVDAEAVETLVGQWDQAVPMFPPGRLRDLATIDHAGLAAVGLSLAGDYLEGPSIESAVLSGRRAVLRLAR